MQLKVRLSDTQFHQGDDELENEFEIGQFSDADKIGARFARLIRNFIRETPVRASRHRTRFMVECWWEENETAAPAPAGDAPRPKRKRKARK